MKSKEEFLEDFEILELLKIAETKLLNEQKESPNRERAIAITNLQTAVLWIKYR